jgi:hypothetical protein
VKNDWNIEPSNIQVKLPIRPAAYLQRWPVETKRGI